MPKIHRQHHLEHWVQTHVPEVSQSTEPWWGRGGRQRNLFPGLLAFGRAVPTYGHVGTGAGPWVLGLPRNVTRRMSALTPETPTRGSPNTCGVTGDHEAGLKSQLGQEQAGKPQARP